MKKLPLLVASLALLAAVALGYSATRAPAHASKARACCTGGACCDGGSCCR
jgi:hypothetical protein